MTATPRYNSYRLIHKGLRARMAEALVAVGRLDAADDDAVEQTLGLVEGLLVLCQGHLESENRYIHAAMEARMPGSAGTTADEHVHHESAIAELYRLCLEVAQARGEERCLHAETLYDALDDFLRENCQHMRFEERYNNSVLWAAYSDDEIRAIEHELVSAIPPEKKIKYLQMMVPAMPPADRARLLGGMRRAMPSPAFAGVVSALMAVLSPTDRSKMARDLGLQAPEALEQAA